MKKLLFLISILFLSHASKGWTNPIPKLNIGMNLSGINYYTSGLVFTNVMCTSNFRVEWDYNLKDVPRDENGYPLQIPYTGQAGKTVRFLISNYYTGKYALLYDGQGKLSAHGIDGVTSAGKTILTFTGTGGNVWIDIESSTLGNHIRNIRIVPEQYADGSPFPTFRSDFLNGLRPFHAFRFMDWLNTNNSEQMSWADRPTKTSASQADNGICLEYCIELCNELQASGWFTIPHKADDDYIRNFARMVKSNLNPNLKAYFEYSNEIWNWQFYQSGWILNNATGSHDQYVVDSLKRINPGSADHPEKDAFMMSRLFKILNDEFPTPAERARIVKVAGVQHGWVDNTRRILLYLKNRAYKIMPDVISPAGYFNFTESDHKKWNAMPPASVTPELIMDAVAIDYPKEEKQWTLQTAAYAKQFGVGYAVYEGGQHMQPYLQGEYAYNPAVYAAQIHPKMYDMYMTNFTTHVDPAVNCQLFMAFSFVGQRESKYGSWGHLESLDQLNQNLMLVAPKYQALLDANIPKSDIPDGIAPTNKSALLIYPNPANDRVTLNFGSPIGKAEISVFDLQGRLMISKSVVDTNSKNIDIRNLKSGIYVLRILNGTKIINSRFVKK